MYESVKTTCPYCGVGCGVILEREGAEYKLIGDKSHPANFGRLCSKGSALGETIDLNGRLLYPCVNKEKVDWQKAINSVADKFKSAIDQYGPDSVAFYVSGQLLSEDYYLANKLMKGFIGSANIDTNSRLCMSSSVSGYKRALGSDTVPCSYEDLERAKLIVLVGSNTAWCHPVLFQRIVKAKKENTDLMVVVVDPRKTSTGDIADVFLQIKAGSDTTLFNGLLHYLYSNDEVNHQFVKNCTSGLEQALASARLSAPSIESVAHSCDLDIAQLEKFYRLFARTERVVTVYSQGVNQSSSGTDKVNSIINCHLLTGRIGRPGAGPFSFTGQPNAMGGREVGGLANTLAAHMELENAKHRDIVQQFWQSPVIADSEGLKAVELFQAVHSGKIKALWIICTNPLVSMPNKEFIRQALTRCEFVAVSECMAETDTTHYADVLLPATTWGEKDGTVTNSERRISRQRAFMPAPGEAKNDWWIIAEVAKAMGFAKAFEYSGPHQIFTEYAELSGIDNHGSRDFDISAMSGLNQQEYDSLEPLQWPINASFPQGKKRMFEDGRFFTGDNRARFIPVNPLEPKFTTTTEYPLVLNTGRIRDQWHTMTRTNKAPRLNTHIPEPYLDVHALDIAQYGLKHSGLVVVSSRWGSAVLRVRCSEEVKPGNVFASMHWNYQACSAGPINNVVNDATDPISGQPEFKYTPVFLKPYEPVWYGFLFSRREINFSEIAYWVKTKRENCWYYELAGNQEQGDLDQWVRSYLCEQQDDVNWIEYHDNKATRYRGARFIKDSIESCMFISSALDLPNRDWLESLFAKPALTREERSNLLIGEAPKGETSRGKTVCACFSVGENTIKDAIAKFNLRSVEAIGEKLQAGTNCGSCVPELRKLLP